MKNLKKVLALGLALVMILGMFTIASAAETKSALDFTDWNEVEHKDAVALCVDLGIINGLPDGSFNPKGTIDRASWAKLVYFTATGDDNADAYLGSATGMKDIVGNWAESYINYLVANKYVAGDGQGNYLPNGTVTVAAGLKTMLTVLGYDADDRGYQNDAAWMGNVMTDAKRNGLMDDVDRAQTAAVNLTRENAAQIVYNALQANTVESESRRDQGQSYVVSYTKGPTLGYDVFNVLKVTGTVKEVEDGVAKFDKLVFANSKEVAGNLNVVSGKVKASAAVVGEEVAVFVKCTGASFSTQTGELSTIPTVKELASTSVAKSAAAPTAVFTNGVTIDHITNEKAAKDADKKGDFVGAAVSADGASVAYYVNGELKSSAPAAAKRGEVVEVYTNGDGLVTTVKITQWKVAKATGAAETKTRSDELQVRIPGVIGWTAADAVDGYQGVAEDDIVLYYTGAGTTVIEKAEVVNGKVNRRNGNSDAKLTMDGTQYQVSGIAFGGDVAKADWDGWKVADLKDNEYDFYLDKNGSVCWVIKVSGEVEKKVAYVLDAAWVGGIGGLNNSTYLEAELLFADDATTQIVRVATVDDKDAESTNASIKGSLIDFSVNSKGNYDVTVKTAKGNDDWGKATDVEGQETKYAIASKVKFNKDNVANDNTVFLVEKVARKDDGKTDGDAEYFVYTGYKNVPKMYAYSVMGVEKDGVVTYAFISTEGFVGEGKDGYVWIKDTTAIDRDDKDHYIYEIVSEDGVETTMALASEFDKQAEAGFYEVTSVSEEKGNTVKAVDKAKLEELDSIGAGIMKDKKGAAYAYDNSTVCVVIDFENDGTKDSFVSSGTFSPSNFTIETSTKDASGNTVSAPYTYKVITVGDAGEVQDFIYIVRTAVPVTTTTVPSGE